MAENNGYMLRMRQIPKPEYKLMKSMVKHFGLKDDSEIFQVALVLMYEVSLYRHEYQEDTGQRWIAQVINTLRTLGDKDRQYDLTPSP